uniref:START domain-containing protein 10 n=1 Tax=Gasterosteus aculeatus aculeatus TaxID=481459 RepID=G3PYG2_GASAC
MSILPDEATFAEFKKQCLSTDNWANKYDKYGMKVWVESPPADKGNNVARVHKIKCSMKIDDVSAATMYDVVHDGLYRKEWDPAMMESYDVARLSANADVGYYSWRCAKPIKNRDVVSLRSWQVKGDEYTVINFSVKHPKYPPCTGFVRAISILTGYFIKPTGPNSCTFIYLSQADPKGSLPKWVVNQASQVFAPRVSDKVTNKSNVLATLANGSTDGSDGRNDHLCGRVSMRLLKSVQWVCMHIREGGFHVSCGTMVTIETKI